MWFLWKKPLAARPGGGGRRAACVGLPAAVPGRLRKSSLAAGALVRVGGLTLSHVGHHTAARCPRGGRTPAMTRPGTIEPSSEVPERPRGTPSVSQPAPLGSCCSRTPRPLAPRSAPLTGRLGYISCRGRRTHLRNGMCLLHPARGCACGQACALTGTGIPAAWLLGGWLLGGCTAESCRWAHLSTST